MAELIDDEKQLEDYKQNKVSTYDYLPQVFFHLLFTFTLSIVIQFI